MSDREPMSSDEARQIAREMLNLLNEDAHARWIPSEKHAEDHALIDELRRERQEQEKRDHGKRKVTREVKVRIIGGLGITGILGLLGLMGYGILVVIQDGLDKLPGG